MWIAVGIVLLLLLVAEVVWKLTFAWWIRRVRKYRLPSLVEEAIQTYIVDLNITGCVVLKERVTEEAVSLACDRVASELLFARTDITPYEVRVADAPRRAAVRGVECSVVSDETVIPHVEEEANQEFVRGECPFRVLLVSDSVKSAVILTCRHVVMDGLSAVELMRRLLILIRDSKARFVDCTEGRVQSCDDFILFPRSVTGALVQAMFSLFELLRESRVMTLRSPSVKPSGSESAIDLQQMQRGKHASRNSSCVVVHTFSVEESKQIVGKAHKNNVTLGNLVCAAAIKAARLSVAPRDVWVSMQADFRRLKAPLKNGFLWGNLTPIVSVSRRGSETDTSVADLAKSVQDEIRHKWNAVRMTASYYLYYGAFSQIFLPLIGRMVITRRDTTIMSVPSLTMSNVGLIVGESSTSRPPLWSAEDVVQMPALESFIGMVTEPVPFPHFVIGSYSFLGRISVSANFSRFAMNRQQAQAFVEALCKHLV